MNGLEIISTADTCDTQNHNNNNYSMSPKINKFLTREPPDGCEKIRIVNEDDRFVQIYRIYIYIYSMTTAFVAWVLITCLNVIADWMQSIARRTAGSCVRCSPRRDSYCFRAEAQRFCQSSNPTTFLPIISRIGLITEKVKYLVMTTNNKTHI